MSRYKIANKTDSLRYKIAKEVFGEIEDCDGVRDIPSWEIFEKTLEQHKQITDLQSQLAEKEIEIENLKEQRHIYLNRSVEECNKITDLEFELQHKDQDKISFAVEQLEKVKEKFGYKHNSQLVISSKQLVEFIDNQIKKLKEGK